MSLLFSSAGHARLDAIVKPGLLCAFDFDGTLTPIVSLPELAMLPAEVRAPLVTLSGYAPVAIITGRAVEDVRQRLGFTPDFIVGNHGSEGLPGWEETAERHRHITHQWHDSLSAWLGQGDCLDKGIVIENKNYSLSVHYRLASDHETAAACLQQLFARLVPLPRIVSGKFVFNLVPQDATDKGTALLQLMQLCGAQSAIYIGDDVTDEDVFRLQRPDVLTVRIECHRDTAAEFFLGRRQDIVQLLEELITRLRAQNARNWVMPIPVSA